ncbi:MAG TPA: hypothetical protein VJX67_14015 [Blastocatellia bacterium]|nr:hypothetical protein [Blastocatellia bacterium]
MPQQNKETVILNLLLSLLAAGMLAFAAWTIVSDKLRAGTDDLFVLVVCLLLALLFAISPLNWALNAGYLPNPFKRKTADEAKAAEKSKVAAH